jgi:hypothetical protein
VSGGCRFRREEVERGSFPEGIRRLVVMHGLVNFVVCELTGMHTHVALDGTPLGGVIADRVQLWMPRLSVCGRAQGSR